MMDGLGSSCPRLQIIYIASVQLSYAAVFALPDAIQVFSLLYSYILFLGKNGLRRLIIITVDTIFHFQGIAVAISCTYLIITHESIYSNLERAGWF
jgi:hypothetical protein